MTDEKKPTALIQNRPVAEDTKQLFDMAFRLAKSTLCPKQYQNKPEDAFAAILAGAEVGFQPMQSLKTIAVINGRASIFGDGLPAVALASGKLKRFSEDFSGTPYEDDFHHWIEIERNDVQGIRRFTFSVGDARTADLWKHGTNANTPWAKYPRRMLQMRNRAYAFRDCFADYLAGLHVAEEQQDIAASTPVYVQSEETPPSFSELAEDSPEEVIDVDAEPVAEPVPLSQEDADALQKPSGGTLFGTDGEPFEDFRAAIGRLQTVDAANRLDDEISAAYAYNEIDGDQHDLLKSMLMNKAGEL